MLLQDLLLVLVPVSDTRYVLRVEGIGKSFGGLEVLKSASLWGEPGKVTTLLGRNGCGKTTLMRIAVGVLRPDYGAVSVFGDVREHQSLPRLARAGLMYVPQEQLVSPGYRVRDHMKALATTFSSDGIDDAVAEDADRRSVGSISSLAFRRRTDASLPGPRPRSGARRARCR